MRSSRILARHGYRTLASEQYRRIKHDIITCKLQPGAMVSQTELMERYASSKTPLREALKLLTQEGLIHPIPSQGHLITPVTLQDVRELFDIRLILEAAALERAAQCATADQLAQIEKLVGERLPLDEEQTRVRWYMNNLCFHVSIAAASGNGRLVQMLRSTLEDLSRVFLLDLGSHPSTEEMVQIHLHIVDALRAGDVERAKSLSKMEIEESLRSTEESIISSGLLSTEEGDILEAPVEVPLLYEEDDITACLGCVVRNQGPRFCLEADDCWGNTLP